MKNEPLKDWYKESFEMLSEDPPADVWDGISASVNTSGEENDSEPVVIPLNAGSNRGKWLKIAAAIALLLGGGFLAFMLTTAPSAADFQQLTYADLLEQHAKNFIESKNLENIDVFYLADGSLVYLNRDSRLSFPETFDGDQRVVVLEGEAFFEVAEDKDHPFVIYSGNTRCEVVGTSFNLRAYDQQENVELTVVTGKVRFSLVGAENDNVVSLTPQERGTFAKADVKLTEATITDETFNDWMEDPAAIAQTSLYVQESSAPAEYMELDSDWEVNAANETVLGGAITNSSALLTFEKVMLKATYFEDNGEKLASKFFEVTEPVLPGQSIDYEHVMRDWIEGTANIDVTIEGIELAE